MKMLLEHKLFMYKIIYTENKHSFRKHDNSFIKGKASSQLYSYCPFDYTAWKHQSKEALISDVL